MFNSIKRTIYLSGPITGIPNKNHELFMEVAGKLRFAGHTVMNPREFTWSQDSFPKRQAFAEYCAFICNRADTIVLLPGWKLSKGASCEASLADNCGIAAYEWEAIKMEFTNV